jgi:hypothetical protein
MDQDFIPRIFFVRFSIGVDADSMAPLTHHDDGLVPEAVENLDPMHRATGGFDRLQNPGHVLSAGHDATSASTGLPQAARTLLGIEPPL